MKDSFGCVTLLAGSFSVSGEPFVNQWFVIVQFRTDVLRILYFRLRGIKIGHVDIFTDGFSIITGFCDDGRYVFPLLIIELSDRMYLVHCKHTPFLLKMLSATTFQGYTRPRMPAMDVLIFL